MSYQINYTDTDVNPVPITVEDQTLNTTDSSLVFVGKNYPGYGKFIGENFLHLLENFASKNAPDNPKTGQLWYYDGSDLDPAEPQLKIYDGTRWVPASGIKKSTAAPSVQTSVTGDLWVDTANQQLYLFAGQKWVLVGPSFSTGTLSGLIVEQVVDKATSTEKSILSFYANDNRVAIISADDFVPKVTIAGFSRIRQGITMSSLDFDGDGQVLNKFWGTAEKSDALVVGNNTVAASNFLRGDTVSTTNYVLNIRNGGGIVVGNDLTTSLTTAQGAALLTNKTPGGSIGLKITNSDATSKEVVSVVSSKTTPGEFYVGINNSGPTESLDVIGNIKTTGIIKTTNTTASTSTSTGALQVAGGAGIAGKLNVGAGLDVAGTTQSGTILPKATTTYNLGSSAAKYNRVYVNQIGDLSDKPEIYGNFHGNITGTLDGAASRLSSTSVFRMIGDVSSNAIPFNGSQSVGNSLIQSVARNGTTSKATIVTTLPHNLVTGYLVTVTVPWQTSFNATNVSITRVNNTTFTYDNSGTTVPTTTTPVGEDEGTVVVSSQVLFNTAISYQFVSEKPQVEFNSESNVKSSDRFLIYRATDVDNDNQPSLLSVKKETILANIGTVPIGSIFPFAGDTPPSGYLLCDGSEQSRSIYSELFTVIGYKYKDFASLRGFQTFALPDLRGRFPLGLDNMYNGNTVNLEIRAVSATRTGQIGTSAITTTFVIANVDTTNGPFQVGKPITGTGLSGTVLVSAVDNNLPAAGQTTITVTCDPQTITTASGLTLISYGTTDSLLSTERPALRIPGATTLGSAGGSETKALSTSNLPNHTHTLKDSSNNQYYAMRYATGTPADPSVSVTYAHNTTNSIHLLPGSGGVSSGTLGQSFNVMNPYLGINYIIFTGRML